MTTALNNMNLMDTLPLVSGNITAPSRLSFPTQDSQRTQQQLSGQANLDSSTMAIREAGRYENSSWLPQPGSFVNPPACVFSVVAAAPTSIFQSALQRLQVTQEADLYTSAEKNSAAISATLEGVYELEDIGEYRSAAREIMIFIESRLRRNALADANQLLCTIDVSHLSNRSMIGLIRSSYRVKAKLPAWKKLYRESWDQVSKTGKDPKSLFVGLPSAVDDDVA